MPRERGQTGNAHWLALQQTPIEKVWRCRYKLWDGGKRLPAVQAVVKNPEAGREATVNKKLF
jgi:hypothetical protein